MGVTEGLGETVIHATHSWFAKLSENIYEQFTRHRYYKLHVSRGNVRTSSHGTSSTTDFVAN